MQVSDRAVEAAARAYSIMEGRSEVDWRQCDREIRVALEAALPYLAASSAPVSPRGEELRLTTAAEQIVDVCRAARLGKTQASVDYNFDHSRAQCIDFALTTLRGAALSAPAPPQPELVPEMLAALKTMIHALDMRLPPGEPSLTAWALKAKQTGTEKVKQEAKATLTAIHVIQKTEAALTAAPSPAPGGGDVNKLWRYLNGYDITDFDKRAEHIMQQSLDGLTIGPSNRNSVKLLLVEHFEQIAATPGSGLKGET